MVPTKVTKINELQWERLGRLSRQRIQKNDYVWWKIEHTPSKQQKQRVEWNADVIQDIKYNSIKR